MNSLECAMVLFFLTVIGVLLYMNYRKSEGFINGSAAGTPALQCGVEFPACPMGTRCVNGYCASTDPPVMPPVTDLPVLPIGPINGRWIEGEPRVPLKD
jgi:hypothetical protein